MAHTISLDLDLRFLHFLEQLRVADDPSSISDLATRFVEACDDTHDGTLRDVSELRDLFEWLSDGSQRAHIPDLRLLLHTMPFAHSYTTSTSPGLSARNSSTVALCLVCTASTRSAIAMTAASPSCSLGGMTGSASVFSWKTKHDRRATTSSGSYVASVFSSMSSVRTSSFAELI